MRNADSPRNMVEKESHDIDTTQLKDHEKLTSINFRNNQEQICQKPNHADVETALLTCPP